MSQEDPVLRSSRREALVVLGVWLGALAWTVGYCVRHGYGRAADDLTFVLGFPDWVFWGIVLPWLVCTAIAIVFAFGFMRDDPLGDEVEESDADADADAEAAPRQNESSHD
jgi:hypothetical protein